MEIFAELIMRNCDNSSFSHLKKMKERHCGFFQYRRLPRTFSLYFPHIFLIYFNTCQAQSVGIFRRKIEVREVSFNPLMWEEGGGVEELNQTYIIYFFKRKCIWVLLPEKFPPPFLVRWREFFFHMTYRPIWPLHREIGFLSIDVFT